MKATDPTRRNRAVELVAAIAVSSKAWTAMLAEYGDRVRQGACLDIEEFDRDHYALFRHALRARMKIPHVGLWPGDQAWQLPVDASRMIRSGITGSRFDAVEFDRVLAEFAEFRHDCIERLLDMVERCEIPVF